MKKICVALGLMIFLPTTACGEKGQVMDGDGVFQTFTYTQISQDGAKAMMTKSKEKTLQSSDVALLIDIDCDRRRAHRDIIKKLQELDYVNYVEEV